MSANCPAAASAIPCLKESGNPGVIVLNDELGDLRALVWRKSLNVLDNFLDAHVERIPHSAGRRKTDSYRRPGPVVLLSLMPSALRSLTSASQLRRFVGQALPLAIPWIRQAMRLPYSPAPFLILIFNSDFRSSAASFLILNPCLLLPS